MVDNSQKKWRDKQRQMGKRMLSFWFSPETIEQMNDIKQRQGITNRVDVIELAVQTLHRQGKPQPILERLEQLERRVSFLEKEPTVRPAADERPPKTKRRMATNKKSDYKPDVIDNIIIEKSDAGTPAPDIANHLNSQGYTTGAGKPWTAKSVWNRRYKIKKNR